MIPTKRLLEELEDRCSKRVRSAPVPKHPPEWSSFYWKNEHGKHRKVFIPTPHGIFYYVIQEFDAEEVENVDIKERWQYHKKCVRIAVSDQSKIDLSIIDAFNCVSKQMKHVVFKELLRALNNSSSEDIGNDSENDSETENDSENDSENDFETDSDDSPYCPKLYIITSYEIVDIFDKPIESRFKYNQSHYEMVISSDKEHRSLRRKMDRLLTLAAKRCETDERRIFCRYKGPY